jgi:hypothetical protein
MANNGEIIRNFLDAYGSGEIERIMPYFSPQAVFIGSTGPEPGHVAVGHAEIYASLSALLKGMEGTAFKITGIWGHGSDYFATWQITERNDASGTILVKGIDHFQVKKGQIDLKDAYRKVRAI